MKKKRFVLLFMGFATLVFLAAFWLVRPEKSFDSIRQCRKWTAGPYMDREISNESIKAWDTLERDVQGVPTYYLEKEKRQVRHPVFVTGRILSGGWGTGLRRSDPRWTQIKNILDAMVRGSQNEIGGFIYPFDHVAGVYRYKFKKGWISAMAQGRFLSVIARLYATAGSDKASKKQLSEYAQTIMNPLHKEVKDGGVLQRYCMSRGFECLDWYTEYPARIPAYTLNGFIYTLVGLYDWAMVSGDRDAEQLFIRGLYTLEHMLPLYDSAPTTNYDLAHLTWAAERRLRPQRHKRYHNC